MPQSLLRRIWQKLENLSAGDILPQFRSAEGSYQLLPTTTSLDSRENMRRKGLCQRTNPLVLLFVFLLLLISGVSAGVILQRSESFGKRLARVYLSLVNV
jgi:hypothetical protein